MNAIARALIPILILTCGFARAFDVLPEYQGFSEDEMQVFLKPADLDGEYQSLITAFTLPWSWEESWQDRPRAFDLSVGSLSNKHFFDYRRLRIPVELTDRLSFRLTHFSQRDRETDQRRNVLELNYRLAPKWSVHAYGEPSHYKRENDLGFAATYAPAPGDEHRFYYTMHDFTRDDHSDRDDHFAKRRNPHSAGWNFTRARGENRARLGFRYDRPADWVWPSEGQRMYYHKRLLYADLAKHLEGGDIAGLRLQWDSTVKSRAPEGASSTITEESWRQKRAQAKAFWQHRRESDPWSLESFFSLAAREWNDVAGRGISHLNYLPGATLNLRSYEREGGHDLIRLGTELNYFKTYGDLGLTSSAQDHERLQWRALTAYEFNFRAGAKFMLALNFDLDEWTPIPTFEGGQGMFRADF